MAHQRSPEADYSQANVTSKKSWAELGSVSEQYANPGEEVPQPAGGSMHVAVHLGHQVVLEWGDVHLLGDLCKRI